MYVIVGYAIVTAYPHRHIITSVILCFFLCDFILFCNLLIGPVSVSRYTARLRTIGADLGTGH